VLPGTLDLSSLHEDDPIVPLSQNIQFQCHQLIPLGVCVVQYDIGNSKCIGISAIRAIVTGMIMSVEIFLPMISVLNGLAREMITLAEIVLPMINGLRSLVTEMIMLVETVLPMVRINLSTPPLPGIVVTLYPYPDILMIVDVSPKYWYIPT